MEVEASQVLLDLVVRSGSRHRRLEVRRQPRSADKAISSPSPSCIFPPARRTSLTCPSRRGPAGFAPRRSRCSQRGSRRSRDHLREAFRGEDGRGRRKWRPWRGFGLRWTGGAVAAVSRAARAAGKGPYGDQRHGGAEREKGRSESSEAIAFWIVLVGSVHSALSRLPQKHAGSSEPNPGTQATEPTLERTRQAAQVARLPLLFSSMYAGPSKSPASARKVSDGETVRSFAYHALAWLTPPCVLQLRALAEADASTSALPPQTPQGSRRRSIRTPRQVQQLLSARKVSASGRKSRTREEKEQTPGQLLRALSRSE